MSIKPVGRKGMRTVLAPGVHRKGFLYAFTLGVLGLIIILVHLFAAREQVISTESFTMGTSAFSALHGLLDRQLVLQYIDIGSLHAAYDGINDVLRRGGYAEAPCGRIGEVAYWYADGKECMPTRLNMSAQLGALVEQHHWTGQLGKRNPFVQRQQSARDFAYYADVGQGRTVIEGYAMQPYLITVHCRTRAKREPLNIIARGVGNVLDVFGWDPSRYEQLTYACGQMAVRPNFHHEINASGDTLLQASPLIGTLKKCDCDPAPASCLKSAMTAQDWKLTIAEETPQATSAVLAKKLGSLPGLDEPLTARVGMKLRSAANPSCTP